VRYLGGQRHASGCKEIAAGRLSRQHAELALLDEANEVVDLLLERGLIEVLLRIRVGRLAASVRVAEGRHDVC
jgi:hypothetical protein